MQWLEEKYILLLSNRLEKFSRLSQTVFNFRCPICHDSKTNKQKARGYFYSKLNKFNFHCHNCSRSLKFKDFLKLIDPELYYSFLKENISNEEKSVVEIKTIQQQSKEFNLDIPKISKFTPNHESQKYLRKRKIPSKWFDILYYTDNFKEFVNSFFPKDEPKFESEKHSIPRIVIPFFDKHNKLFGFQGRALNPKEEIRYISIILDDSKPKLFNLNNVNINKKFYITEGPFDAMFLDNSIACCGSDILSALLSFNFSKNNCSIIFDNEPRNKEISNALNKAISFGYNVCIWPEEFKQKDINDAILSEEYSSSELQALIDFNTYSGLTAELKYTNWKKYNG